MSNVHSFPGVAGPAAGQKKRGPYRKKVSKAEIARAVQSARELGLTVYGVTVEGERVHVQTQPDASSDAASRAAVDAWFDNHD